MNLPKEKMMHAPESVFETPKQLLDCIELSIEQKIDILIQWKNEAMHRQVSAEENMEGVPDADANLIQQISNALTTLDSSYEDRSAPTKS